MFLNLLVSLCCVVHSGDTLDVATVSSVRNAAAEALSPVRRLSEDAIARIGTVGLHEALKQFSGVSIKDYGGTGGLKTVSVRNMGASHTAVVYDGIAISDAQNGQTDISRFNLDDISSLSMSIALPDDIFCSARHVTCGGVLRLESSVPDFRDGPAELVARITAGSFGTYIPYVSLRHRLGRGYYLKTSLNGTFSEGAYPFTLKNGRISTTERRINSDVTSYGAEADLRADWGEDGTLKAKVNFHQSERGLPGSVVLYTQNAFERLWDRSVISNASYEREWGRSWKLHADAGFTNSWNRHLDTNPAYPSERENIYSQNEYSVAVRMLYMPSDRWNLVLAEDLFVNSLDSNIPECPFPVRVSNATALSARYEGTAFKVTAAVAGMYVTETLEDGDVPPDRFRLSPSVGISWNFHKGMHLRASFKEGFRVPTFNDLYYARVGNRNLRPETARQCNIGLTCSRIYEWGTVDVTADGYYNFIKDKIVAVPTMFIWKMRNVGEVAMYGADITASALWRVCNRLFLHVSGNYSLQYALDVTDPSSKSYRHQIPYTPRHCGSGYITVETPWINISYRLNASGKRYSMDQNIPANEIEGYADHCVSLNREFAFGKSHGCKIRISLEALNLADNNYEIIHYYPMPGRSYRITLKFNY